MSKMEQHQGEISNVASRYLRRQSLAAIATLHGKEKNVGVKINEMQPSAHRNQTLQRLNNNSRSSPRKHTEMQPSPNQTRSSKLNLGRTEMQPPARKIQTPTINLGPNSTPINTDPLNDMAVLNNPGSNDSDDGIQQERTRKIRGKTMMKTFSCMPNEKDEIEFNERGQPIGSNSKHLSSYLGTLAREMVPLTISEWKKVDTNLKKDLWTCIQL